MNKKIILPVLVLFLLVTSGVTFYFYQKASAIKADPNIVIQKEIDEIVKRVSKIILLPEDETPTVFTVSDPEKLKDQPFFARAKVGDQALFYTNARKAYLYDPVNNKILEIALVNLDIQASTQTVPKITESIKINEKDSVEDNTVEDDIEE